jgi:Capsule polysaccharide biosynthesis protein
MTRDTVAVETTAGTREVGLERYLDAAQDERARAETHGWIKELRRLTIDGETLRRRFTCRGDSLWWFAELYLHKQQAMLEVFRTIAALNHLVDTEQPRALRVVAGGRILRGLTAEVTRARAIRSTGASGFDRSRAALARLDLRSRALGAASRMSRLRRRPASPAGTKAVAAFIHTAFWRAGSDEGGAEAYIGPVLEALEARRPGDIQYIGVGPVENFRARRWWRTAWSSLPSATVVPVEAFAPLSALESSRRVWTDRYRNLKALWKSDALRRHAVIAGCDCWPIVREELAGIALLQWPWSARAMDEAAAALDAVKPQLALTYAEAGGWGRALMLECRRRGIRSAALQHGFIYRHWLNYRHEPDEMIPDERAPADRGFPRPDLTLLFDQYAAAHLEREGRFPSGSLVVTGSPRLDALLAAARALDAPAIERARLGAGAEADQALVLLVTKHREARDVLPALVDAVSAMPDVHLAIKPHPAETAELYAGLAARSTNIRVLASAAPLAPLLAASRAVVTVNSTVALDAAVLGVPSLVVGLPNNLTPLVDAGVMAGAADADAIGPALRQILYDQGFRQQIERDRSAFLTRFAIGSDGRAAARSAEALVGLMNRSS